MKLKRIVVAIIASIFVFSHLPISTFAETSTQNSYLTPPVSTEPYNEGPQSPEEAAKTMIDVQNTEFVQKALETAKVYNPNVTQNDIYKAIDKYNITRDVSKANPPKAECTKNALTGELECKQEFLPLVLLAITAEVAAEWAVNALVVTVVGAAAGAYLAVLGESIRNNYIQNGWVSFKVNYFGNEMWMYKEYGMYLYNGWMGNYWLSDDGMMYDPTYKKSKWALLIQSNNITYHKRWFLFNTGGSLNTTHEGQWYMYNGKWMYQVPGNLGFATNECILINGHYYTFDSDGYLWE